MKESMKLFLMHWNDGKLKEILINSKKLSFSRLIWTWPSILEVLKNKEIFRSKLKNRKKWIWNKKTISQTHLTKRKRSKKRFLKEPYRISLYLSTQSVFPNQSMILIWTLIKQAKMPRILLSTNW